MNARRRKKALKKLVEGRPLTPAERQAIQYEWRRECRRMREMFPWALERLNQEMQRAAKQLRAWLQPAATGGEAHD